MTPNSILIKSITGEIYKITDLAKGIKQPLQPSELAGYNMHPQSGVLMDTDGKLIDLVELLVSGNRVQISEEGKPDNPSTNALYVDKSARSIAVFDEKTGEWIELGNGNGDSSRSNAIAIDWDGLIYLNNSDAGIDLSNLTTKSHLLAFSFFLLIGSSFASKVILFSNVSSKINT